MRLFLALAIPAAVKDAVVERMAVEKRRLPATRWVRPVGLHLTLAFLGETAEELLPGLEEAVAKVCRASPRFSLMVTGAGTFPPKKPARVAWLGIRSGRGEDRDLYSLMGLQRRVEKAAFTAAGKDPGRRPFHPHLTLGRARSPWPRRAVEQFTTVFDGEFGAPFGVEEVHLMRSFLEPGSARYETLAKCALAIEEKGANE